MVLSEAVDRATRLVKAGQPDDAKTALTNAQKLLRNIKREATAEERETRSEFQQARIDTSNKGQVLGLLGGSKVRAAAAKGRAFERRSLAQQQQDSMAPFVQLKASIDRALVELDNMKAEVGDPDAESWEGDDDESPSSPPPPPVTQATPPQWSPDPGGRHELRYWNGTAWTDHVSDAGVVGVDSL